MEYALLCNKLLESKTVEKNYYTLGRANFFVSLMRKVKKVFYLILIVRILLIRRYFGKLLSHSFLRKPVFLIILGANGPNWDTK